MFAAFAVIFEPATLDFKNSNLLIDHFKYGCET
jgi:hypothetical protein